MEKTVTTVFCHNKKALFFDFDGVILDSVHVKTDAFAKLYSQYGSNMVRQVRAYHLANAGVSRYDKFRYYNEVLLEIETTEKEIELLDRKFSLLVAEAMEMVSYVPGVYDLLQWAFNLGISSYIVSAAPRSELLKICRIRNIDSFFTEIFGDPISKPDAMTKVFSESGIYPTNCVMFGDSRSDLQAAREIGINFVGINAIDAKYFKEQAVPCLHNFNELDRDVLLNQLTKEKLV